MKRLVMLAAALVVMATTVMNTQSVDPTRALSAGRVAWDSVRLPAATAADTTLTRHAVLVRYANCAAWVVDTVFVDVIPIGADGSGNTTVPRALFWACVSHEGWPSEIRSADFVGSPENWVESIFRSSETDMQSLLIILGMAALDGVELNIDEIRTSNCIVYGNLYYALVLAMDPSDSRADLSPEPAAERVCG